MQPIRGERKEEVVHDGWTHDGKRLGQSDAVHVVTDDGAVESRLTGRTTACVCGCLEKPGGFCSECIQPVCVNCYGFCAGVCHRPLCPRHSVFDTDERGAVVRLCRSCHGQVSRRKVARGVVRALLSPFLRFKDSNG